MKRWLSLFLVAAMLLTFTACGAAETTDAPVAENSTREETPEKQEAAQTDAGSPYVPQTLAPGQTVEEAIHALGYEEVIVDMQQARMVYHLQIQGCTVTPKELAVTEDAFRMTLDYVPYSQLSESLGEPEEWILYGTYADEIGDISEVDLEEYVQHSAVVIDNLQGADQETIEELLSYGWIYYIQGQYRYNKPDDDGEVYVLAVYFPLTGRLYNLVRYFDTTPVEMSIPWMFQQDSMEQEILDNMAELLTMEFPEEETTETEAQ